MAENLPVLDARSRVHDCVFIEAELGFRKVFARLVLREQAAMESAIRQFKVDCESCGTLVAAQVKAKQFDKTKSFTAESLIRKRIRPRTAIVVHDKKFKVQRNACAVRMKCQ
jgi:hypothetical protein